MQGRTGGGGELGDFSPLSPFFAVMYSVNQIWIMSLIFEYPWKI